MKYHDINPRSLEGNIDHDIPQLKDGFVFDVCLQATPHMNDNGL